MNEKNALKKQNSDKININHDKNFKIKENKSVKVKMNIEQCIIINLSEY